MKKVLVSSLIGLAVLGSHSAFAVQTPVNIVVDGNRMTGSNTFIDSDTGATMAPIDDLAFALGVPMSYDSDKNIIHYTVDGTTVALRVNTPDGGEGASDHVLTIDGVTYVPVKCMMQATGATLSWDSANNSVNIASPDKAQVWNPGHLHSLANVWFPSC
jgi:hypothetical protein